MRQETGKLNTWWDRNKNKIKAVAVSGLCGTVGYIVGSKFCEFKTAYGLEVFHENGIIKFFDPTTNLEVTAAEAINVAKRTFNK